MFEIAQKSAPPPATATVSHVRVGKDGTTTVSVHLSGSGTVDVLETAWIDNLATTGLSPPRTAGPLLPAGGRFVVARSSTSAAAPGKFRLSLTPNGRGMLLLREHRFPITYRLWVRFTSPS